MTATARRSTRRATPQFNEFGPSTNLNLAIPGGSTKIADGLPRPNNWEESVSVQHELFPRMSVTGGYYRRQFYNIQYTKNRALDPVQDFTPFTVTIPNTPGPPWTAAVRSSRCTT